MNKVLSVFMFALALIAGNPLSAQTTNAVTEDPAHKELRALRDGLVAAMNIGDLEATLKYLHTNCVITWHDGEVSRGHAGVRAYHDRMMTGPTKMVESYNCEVMPDELTILYGGNMGICLGSSHEQFKLANGKDLKFTGRWSATLVKENGHWLVANLHASTNLFDNVLLTLAKQVAWVVGLVSLLIGAGVGWWIGRKMSAAKA